MIKTPQNCPWSVVRCPLFSLRQLIALSSAFNVRQRNNGQLTTDHGQLSFLPRFAIAFAEDDACEREATGVSLLRPLHAADGEQGDDLGLVGDVELALDGRRIET